MITEDKAFTVFLGKKLQERRQARKFTLEQIISEARLGISRSSLSAIENGNQEISAKDLYALSMVLGFDVSELMDEIAREILVKKFSVNIE